MFLVVLIVVLCFVTGLGVAWLLSRLLGGMLDGPNPVRLGAWMLFGALVVLGVTYFLGTWIGNGYVLYVGAFVAGILSLLPLMLLVGLYLLWWNPEKYKEYEMKNRRRQRQLKFETDREAENR